MGAHLKSPLPKISFGVIVLNGEPFNRYCLKSLYPYAHEIIVVEGAVKGAEAVSSPDGHSTDGTLEIIKRFKEEEDPENKIILITRDGFWEEKDQMSEAYAEAVSGDWLWQVDIDEFYKEEDMNFICNLMDERPEITEISFEQKTFWGSPDYICDSSYLQQGASLYHRIFKWAPEYKYKTHRPPTVIDPAGVSLCEINPLSGVDLAAVGVYMYHYSLLFPKQVREKVAYYSTWNGKAQRKMPKWMDDDYFGMNNPFHLHNVTSHPGWLERYTGPHPKQVVEMWNEVKTGKKSVEIRPMDDVEEFIDSNSYRQGILDIRAELRRRDHPDIKMDDPVLRSVINKEDSPYGYKIIQISTNESRGGAAQVHNSICELFSGRDDGKFGVSSFVKDTDNNAPWCKPLYLESIEKQVSTVATPLMDYDIASSFYLLQKPEFLKSDLVHMHNIHGYYFNPLTLPLVSLLKPTVWTLHDMNPFTGHCGNSLECEGWRNGCKSCAHLDYYPQLKKDVAGDLFRDKRIISSVIDTTLVCPSQWLVDLVKQTFLSKLDCKMIPNGIDTNIFKPYLKDEARKILGIPKDAFVLVITAKGGMQSKGGEFLERAGKELQQRNSKLVLLNIGGTYHSDSVNIINFPYIADRNVLALAYSSGDVFAYPSLGDNHPLCVMEAMACGLPVVTFRTGGIPEQVVEGETGLIADYMNQEQFTQSLGMLMDRPSLCKAMSMKAAQHGRSFKVEKMVDSYARLYEEVLERRSRNGAPDVGKVSRALEYLQSRLAQVGNTAGVEVYKMMFEDRVV
ncbi:Glycosyltransferase involved in cell wall bisynthesis [Maridesulfovibrio ferrireducens]|uniref:Glycosyltransferase involved in cell wall bisynthesis n=1 Tax=Maridesulfovibrio ferrireducens TaxID=246191 RepID=A0A1G9ESM6_9BACT|nr:glycosyltransferase [Maridesulfovibrio ferrireducens]SDK79051.1 Glycosyltransferase involved in cell wall bisynthesis [Maridesulfovibrio ferrireducens]